MTCDDIRVLLDEYHDRELDPPRAESVRVHVAACAPCAGELHRMENLDRALRAAPTLSDDVRWEGYVDRIRDRVHARGRVSWKAVVPLAAAALIVIAFARTFPPETHPSLLDRYATATPAERARLENSVLTLNRDGLGSLALAMVADPDPARRRYAARLLAPRLNDPAIQELVLARSLELQDRDAEETVLIDLGFEPGDEELVGPALDMARSPANFGDAIRILRRLDRGTLNRKAHAEIVSRLRELLGSDLPRERELAVRIAGELEILTEDVVEFLDVPELGVRVIEFLRRRTGKDFGMDKSAWRAWFARQTGRM